MMQFGTILTDASKTSGAGNDLIQGALEAVRKHLDMEVAYFSEFVDGRTVFRHVDAPGLEHLIKVGDSQSLDDVYCNHILEGRLPEIIPDTSLEPLARSMPITGAVPIGSHVSIPILMPDGRPFGMFCCLSPRPNPTLNDRDLATMRVFANLATKQVQTEIESRESEGRKRRAIEGIIASSAFDIVLQPIVDLVSMRQTSMEALCRFRPQPYRSPDKWFQDAGDVGRGVDVELAAIRAAVELFDLIPDDVGLSINASPETIVSGRLSDALDPRNLARTIVEVTEHASVEDYDEIHRAMRPLREAGVMIAIDDAGAGYSGLKHIVQMMPDIIKLDMSLTRGIDGDPARRALASAMIHYAREVGAIIVAEGIETEGELQVLKTLGITRGQGYLLGKPAALSPAGPTPKISVRSAA